MNEQEAQLDAFLAGRTCGRCCTQLTDFGVTLGGATILERINLHVHCGELTVLIGPNGAGKTTFLRAILGELPHTGALRFVHAGEEERSMRPRIGYVPQRLELDAQAPVSVLDLFAGALAQRPLWAGYSPQLKAEARTMLALVEADALWEIPVGRLSCGQLQRVLLALALTPIPDLLLLDEPVSGVDPAGTEMFYRIVSELRRRLDLSILLVSHDLSAAARVADRMLFLNRTIRCDGSPRAVLAGAEVRQTFGIHTAPETPPTAPRHHPACEGARGRDVQ